MNAFALLVLLGWAPLAMALFVVMPARRAVLVGVIAGWLLLPPGGIDFAGFPGYDKAHAASFGVLLGTVLFQTDRLLSFRPRWFDLPMILWFFCPSISSLTNGFPILEAASTLTVTLGSWLLPYLIGRLYFSDSEGLRELALGIVVGGMCLIPACLFENRVSPILLPTIYSIDSGFVPSRFGGFRPRVFFRTGIELGLWMNVTAVAAFWLWQTKQLVPLPRLSPRMTFALMFVTAILCRSIGAIVLLFSGIGLLWFCRRTNRKWAMWCALCLAPLYYSVRIPNLWTGEGVVALVDATVGSSSAGSLNYRLTYEQVFIKRALEHPAFGWDGWGRNFARDENGYLPGIDSLWVITFGCNGYVGLFLMNAAMLLPVALFLVRFPVAQWTHPSLAAAAVLAVILNLFLIDCLFNAFPNGIYIVIAGDLAGLTAVPELRAGAHAGSGSVSREILAARYRAEGRTAKEEGRLSDAKDAWNRALDVLKSSPTSEPGRQMIHQQWCECANDLAWLLVNAPDPTNRDLAHAVRLAVKATESQPEYGTYWNTLGVAYYRTGDFNAAIAALNRAVSLAQGGNAFDHVFLAMAHARLGDQEQSRHWLALATTGTEKDFPAHAELNRFCTEAHSVVETGPDPPALTPLS